MIVFRAYTSFGSSHFKLSSQNPIGFQHNPMIFLRMCMQCSANLMKSFFVPLCCISLKVLGSRPMSLTQKMWKVMAENCVNSECRVLRASRLSGFLSRTCACQKRDSIISRGSLNWEKLLWLKFCQANSLIVFISLRSRTSSPVLQIASFLHTKLQSLSLEERAGLREYLRLKNSQKPLSVCCNFLTVSGFELPSAVTWNVLGSEKTLCKLQNVFSTIAIFFIFV